MLRGKEAVRKSLCTPQQPGLKSFLLSVISKQAEQKDPQLTVDLKLSWTFVPGLVHVEEFTFIKILLHTSKTLFVVLLL